jgi:hypothetical protein
MGQGIFGIQMKNGIRIAVLITLVLGLAGIILGICVGLYRSDQLAKLQEAGAATGGASRESNAQYEFLLYTNIPTLLLTFGTLTTLLSAMLFLISIRHQVD